MTLLIPEVKVLLSGNCSINWSEITPEDLQLMASVTAVRYLTNIPQTKVN